MRRPAVLLGGLWMVVMGIGWVSMLWEAWSLDKSIIKVALESLVYPLFALPGWFAMKWGHGQRGKKD